MITLSPKMLKVLTDRWADGHITADRRTEKALKARGLIRYQVMYVGVSPAHPSGDVWGYWPTVEAFELLEDIEKGLK